MFAYQKDVMIVVFPGNFLRQNNTRYPANRLNSLLYISCFFFVNLIFVLLGVAFRIDICPSNGNLLVSCGSERTVKIFDKRESKVVKSFRGIHDLKIF